MPKVSKGEIQVDEEVQVNHMITTTAAKNLKRSKKKFNGPIEETIV